jgi:hypothetical protein
MRASDLIGQRVIDRDGTPVGIVTDLRCVLDSSFHSGQPTPRLDALVVSGRRLGSVLGYDRRGQQGPWLVRIIVRHLHRKLRVVPWNAVQPDMGSTEPAIRLRIRANEIN